MIPIVAINNLVTAIVAAAITGLIAQSYRRHQDDQLLKDFLLFFAFLTIFFGLLAIPGLLIFNETILGIIARISNIILSLAAAFFITIPVNLFGRPKLASFVFWIILLFGVTIVILDFYFFKPSALKITNHIFYYATQQVQVIRLLAGSVPLVSAIIGSFFFIKFGRLMEDSVVRKRSYFLGFGMSSFICASIFNFIIFTMSFSLSPLLVASLLALVGIILMGIGILMKPKT